MHDVKSAPLAIGLELVDRTDRVEARAILELEGVSYESSGTAVRTGRTAGAIASPLAVSRALRAIEAAVMETVHERIDRFVANE